jgi:hypothetical protein
MKSENLELYCVTNQEETYLENTNLHLAGVGKKSFSNKYLLCNNGDNIFYKEEYYSELTFHYWYWKNKLDIKNKNWIGFCQRRRHWILRESIKKTITKNNLSKHIIQFPEPDWNNFESIICEPISVNPVKKIKIFKRGWKSLIKDPTILFFKKKQNLLLHFDMHHGHGNLKKTIKYLKKEDQEDFLNFVSTSTKFNPHIMYIAKSNTLNNWFIDLFAWLNKCEDLFSKNNLINYDTKRIFAFLAERYASFWFKKYTNFKEHPWVFIDPGM